MFKRPATLSSIQQNFQEIRARLTGLTGNLVKHAAAESTDIVREVSRVTELLVELEQAAVDQLRIKENQLAALMKVGQTINSSLGKKRVLEEVMDRLIELMHAERGFLMLKRPDGRLEFEIARGIDHVNLEEESFKVSRTIVERVAASGETILTTNAQDDPRFEHQLSVAAFRLRSILCAPLKIKEQLIGVIYVDNRARAGTFQVQDQNLITAFADQAAVAIDNAQLFEDLQHKNRELEEAYQATLEGWVSALDMRDKETEGHTQRVTVLTQRLARFMGVGDDELVHITRGALLHDIGKMAIPDSILLKPGPLTEAERELVKQHPKFAYDMLKRIEFLLPAIDIPYCHHEKWDGTGYPRGLKGEEIPFAARIFPVVDVWDALTSDRPYRQGLPMDEVKERIRADAGKHFDPHVVDAFLTMGDYSV
ncbi:MAG: HD-GYP domain-containing protein [Chloroflexota bacterium]|nr:GAF domain-containing protein [Chloroflexota bacterium]MBI5705264.1 GAF domain-containing protein [Chloroflexota bacterium]